MKKKQIIIFGAGRHAAETYEYYHANEELKSVIGFMVEENFKTNSEFYGLPIYDTSEMEKLLLIPELYFIIAIGSPVRRRLVSFLSDYSVQFDNLIAKQNYIGEKVFVGEGSTLGAGGIYTTNIHIGKHNIINVGCSFSHDCTIGDYVTIAPRVTLAGKVKIEDDVFIGAGATIIDGITIGKSSVVAAGAVVIENVPENVMVAGVPAVIKRKLD